MSLVSRCLAALFKDAYSSQAQPSASQSQAGRPFSLMVFNQLMLLYSNFPLPTRLLKAGGIKAARWVCWLWTRTHAYLEQQLGSLGHPKKHCMPVGVLTCTPSVGFRTQLSKCPLCRCPRCCRAFQMALGVQLWPLSQTWRRRLVCPSDLHTAVQSEWLTYVYADVFTSPGCLG